MKTVLDLPEALLREIEVRALSEGRKVEDFCVELVVEGMSHLPQGNHRDNKVVSKDLPHMNARPAPPCEVPKLTTQEWCDWIKDADLQLDIKQHEKALGHQHVDSADA